MGQRSLNQLVAEDKAKKCPECGCPDTVIENEEIVCRACGLVLE